jgi:hypothetical protein
MIAAAISLGGAAALLTPSQTFAQDYTTGSLEGVVYSENGSPASGVEVTLRSTDRGFARTTITGSNGVYRFPRLPIGGYEVGVTGAPDPEMFRIAVGATTRKDLAASGNIDEIVTTGTVQNIYDFDASTTGLTLDVDETFADIPIPRNITGLTLLTPGAASGDTAFGNLVSLGGSSVAENVYYVNGMNTTDFRNFLGSAAVPFEFYEQVQTKTGGLPAEFGRTTGGVSNAVTKSGTNEWKFGASVYHEANSLRATQDDIRSQATGDLLTARRDAETERTEYNFWASGPIIEDRVFAYALYSPRSLEQRANSFTGNSTSILSDSDPFYGGKLDINITDKHLVELTGWRSFNSRETTQFDATFDPDTGELLSQTGDGLVGFSESGGDIWSAKYTGQFTDNFTVSVMYGEQENARTAQSAADVNPVIRDRRIPANGFVDVDQALNFLVSVGNDKRQLFRADADLYVDDLFGDHHFRFGYDQEKLTAVSNAVLSGGTYFVYFDADACDSLRAAPTGEECLRIREYSAGGEFDVETTAFYLQDAWDVTDKLTLNLGIRNETFENFNGTGEGFIEVKNQWAPRLGFTYQPSMDESGTLFGSFSRYFLPVAANTNIRSAGAETFIHRWYEFTGINSDFTPQFDPETIFATQIFGDGVAPSPESLVDRNLKPQNMDEFIIGYRTSLNDKVSGEIGHWDIGAAFTYNRLNRVIEDISIDQGVLAYCTANNIDGCEDEFGPRILHQYVLTNPGNDVDVVVDDFPGGPQRITLTADQLGYPKAEREYTALEFTFDRVHADDGFYLSGSYTWSSSKGNYEGSVKSDNGQDDAGLTTDFDFPQLTDFADGFLPNHRRHKLKIFGNYELTDAINIGANIQVNSPRKFGCLGADPDGFTTDLYGSAWYCGGVPTPRGSQIESDWQKTVDLTMGFTVPNLPVGTLTLRADIFNIFNDQSVLDRREFGVESVNSGTGVLTSDLSEYGRPTRYQTPRYVRLGADFRF